MDKHDDRFVVKIDQVMSSNNLYNKKNNSTRDYTVEIEGSQDGAGEEPFLSTRNNKDDSASQGNTFFLGEDKNYKIRRIEIAPKGIIKLHKHFHKNEFLYVLNGTAIIRNESQPTNLLVNEFINIPKLSPHSIENQGVINLILLEIQNGEYLGDDDILIMQDNVLL